MLERNATVNKNLYIAQLHRVNEAIQQKKPDRQVQIILLHDNARPHVAQVVKAALQELEWEVLQHPPYSPDLAPTEYHLFRSMSNHMRITTFDDEEDLKTWLNNFFDIRPRDIWWNGINKLVERWEEVVYNNMDSRKNQSFDDFVTKVKNKAVDCDFGDLTESLIRDRIVLGVLDKNLTERYLQDPDLTLSKAIALGRAAESSRTQLKEIKEEVTVDKLSSYKERSSNKNTEHKFVKKNHKLFKACGKCASKHEYGNCPAYGKQCYKCKKPNHYAKCCKNKIVHDIAENDIYMHVLSVDNTG
ncbi:hypothetical protein LAZ67_X003000 [Cordylochernes scorpioides]|uniref:CCHC-type domain-containing protein n=1 Tax=Cordylochernes scorpioides TaxID=51811 RepID=A0ABY6LTT2_9ARAC|nr:hypothetical protein LAZ67_X003000 [Cordylochernes scorpioides]